ncbi:MAG TPA: TIGR03087 family PEP-CTERM/XrtA system glycosyltransferase [Thermoanaerobaculia bacterium]
MNPPASSVSETPQGKPKLLVDLLRHTRPRPAAEGASGLNILYLCHRVPYPPDKGDKIRAYHQIRALARRHRVHLLTLTDGAVPDLTPLHNLCERVEVFPVHRPSAYLRSALGALKMWRPRPLTLAFFDSEELRRRVEELARSERFDVVVAYSSSMAPYVEPFAGVPSVLDMVDVDSAKWEQYSHFARRPMRPVYALEARRLRGYEAEVAERFDRVVLATANEARQLKEIAPKAKVVAVANGVDFDYFRPLDLPKSENPMLVFTGQMDYFANIDGVVFFAREVFPRLRLRFPDLEFIIVGRSPAPAVRALIEIPGVAVTGAVGDVRPFLARAWAFVAPLRIAQGVQNKVLEAMAMGLPVVCSERVLAGLAEGGFRHGRDLLAASSAEGLESCLASLLEDAEARHRLADCARQLLGAAYRWGANLDKFEEQLAAVTRLQPSSGGAPKRKSDTGVLSLTPPATADGGARSA